MNKNQKQQLVDNAEIEWRRRELRKPLKHSGTLSDIFDYSLCLLPYRSWHDAIVCALGPLVAEKEMLP